MALIPSQVLRLAILLSYFSILCNYKAIDMPAHQTYGGSWKFLTFINLGPDSYWQCLFGLRISVFHPGFPFLIRFCWDWNFCF
ncbi:androgen-induced gene 1 protein isoform X1 [Latimeria chalumnae]|uniref:androgen-induced gene 1 protein isoform X1 n=1 Tax=Latimeria chalumnae TaxID=7897 RepID=UPI00313B5421